MSYTRILRSALAGALAGLAMTIAVQGAAAENWKCYTTYPAPTHPTVVAISKVGEALTAATNGRIKVECRAGGQLPIDANSITSALSDGVLDMAANGFVSGAVPVAGLFALPGLITTPEELEKAYAEVVKPIVEKAFLDQGVQILAMYYWPENIFFSKVPLTSVADLKGKSIRVKNAEEAEFVKAVGGVPVSLPAADTIPALDRGAVQVALTAAVGGGRLWRDQFDYALVAPTSLTIEWSMVSKARWDELSPDEQKALKAAADEQAAWLKKTLQDETSALLTELAEKDKIVITQASAEDIATISGAAIQPVWENWAKSRGPEMVEILAATRKVLNK